MSDLWMYRQPMERGLDLEGFDVEAVDGKIGTIDEATYEVDSSYIVVDTGPWIFGRKVLLPAGVVDEIDFGENSFCAGTNRQCDRSVRQDASQSAECGDRHYRVADPIRAAHNDSFDLICRHKICALENHPQAIVDPEKLSKYFVSNASAPVAAGQPVKWIFADVGGELTPQIEVVERNERFIRRNPTDVIAVFFALDLHEPQSATVLRHLREANPQTPIVIRVSTEGFGDPPLPENCETVADTASISEQVHVLRRALEGGA